MADFQQHRPHFLMVSGLRRRQYSTVQPSPTPNSRFAPYRQALNALAVRTRTPLPSLVFSFAVLHELTAVVPLVGFFYAARALNLGNRFTNLIPARVSKDDAEPSSREEGWIAGQARDWWKDGMLWAERVGKRYGMFGFEKGEGRPSSIIAARNSDKDAWEPWLPDRFEGDLVNAVVAYCLTKALLPVRIGVSLYLSPVFSRRVIEPGRLAVVRAFRQRS